MSGLLTKRVLLIVVSAAWLGLGVVDLCVLLPLRYVGNLSEAWSASDPFGTLALLAFWVISSVAVIAFQASRLGRPGPGFEQPGSWWRAVRAFLVCLAAIGFFAWIPGWAISVRLTTHDASASVPWFVGGLIMTVGLLATGAAAIMYAIGLVRPRSSSRPQSS